MNVIAIDTHEVVKELKAVGFSEDQAEAVTRVVRRSQDIDLSPLATKADLEIATSATKADIDALRKDTRADIDALGKDTRADIDALRKDTRADIDALRKDTKADIDALRRDTRADFDALRKDMDILRTDVKANLAEQKADLLKWVIGAIGFQTIVILGAVLALAHALRP